MRNRVRRAAVDNAARVEGEPFYSLHEFQLSPEVVVAFRCFDELPLTDAVGLLSGNDQTGLIVWEGTLRLLEFLCETHFPDAYRPVADTSLTLVELGCGCGALSTGVLELWSCCTTRSPKLRVVATDGNEDCVGLALRNMLSVEGSIDVDRAALLYQWGTAVPEALQERIQYPHGVQGEAGSSSLIILSGDVIYSAEAIVPLVQAVVSCSNLSHAPCTWILSYIPRSLTLGANQCIFEELRSALAHLPCGRPATFYPFKDVPGGSPWWHNPSAVLESEFGLGGFLAVMHLR